MRRLGILALAVAAACALPLAGCLDIRDKDGLINTQQPIEAGKDAEDESGTEEHPTDDGVGPSSSMQQQIEDADEEAKGGDAASTWLETDDELPIDLEADENIHVRAECKDTDGYATTNRQLAVVLPQLVAVPAAELRSAPEASVTTTLSV